MRFFGRRITRLVFAVTAWVAVTAPLSSLASQDDRFPELARVNRKWRGAVCRIRIPIKITKDRDSKGWSASHLLTVQPPGKKAFVFTMAVSDRKALRGILRNGQIPVGTDFVCEGWRLTKPESRRGIVLDLRFKDVPVKAQMRFGAALRVPLKRLDEVENYARIQAFAISAADERLTMVPDPGSGTGAPHQSRQDPTSAPAPDTRFDPHVEVVAVSVAPAQVSRGSKVDLIINYQISGIPPGATFDVKEVREVSHDGRAIRTLEEALDRSAGTYTSKQTLSVPANASPGLYRLEAKVTLAGMTANGSVLFEVR